jgi:hypothetical protein
MALSNKLWHRDSIIEIVFPISAKISTYKISLIVQL